LSVEQLAVLALAAVLVFWMVGAYNRLVALRNAIAAAWAGVAETLRQRSEVVAPLLAALHGPLAAEHGALDALRSSHGQAQASATEMTAHPLSPAVVTGWRNAESALASAASRVLALLDQHAELRTAPAAATAVATWQLAESRLVYGCQVFDAAVVAYNEATAQLPTRWLLRLFGFEPAGRLKG
jgi:LemA protein